MDLHACQQVHSWMIMNMDLPAHVDLPAQRGLARTKWIRPPKSTWVGKFH